MKIRIKGNSIRFRLSVTDIRIFRETGELEERTHFGNTVFKYGLATRTGGDKLIAICIDNRITVNMPVDWVTEWPEDRVGYDQQQENANGEILYILVEKDFKCIDKTSEDQSDFFENPNENCI